ncbi:MAG: threonylcarbamoyl-AMP synthase [Clostridia bacterium]|nr:threonylcarbamoyl-AMP synthase [Clostridia bacterium]
MTTKFISADPERFAESDLSDAAKAIRDGGLVAFPTETVYGLGASGINDRAVKRIFEAKGRPSNNPLILHFASVGDCNEYAVCDDRFLALADAFMPGPLTVVLPSRGNCAPSVTAGLSTVAVRVPMHPVARSLIKAAGVPIAAPSANLSGKPSPTTCDHVKNDLNGKVEFVIDGGACTVGLESTIVKLDPTGATLLRPGGITLEMLKSVLGEVDVAPEVLAPPAPGAVPESPGMLLKHYSPNAPLYLVRSDDHARLTSFFHEASMQPDNAIICFNGDVNPKNNVYYLGDRDDEFEHARRLFDLLRVADKPGIRRIYAPMPRREGIGLALQNRMLRAAAFRIKDI